MPCGKLVLSLRFLLHHENNINNTHSFMYLCAFYFLLLIEKILEFILLTYTTHITYNHLYFPLPPLIH